MGRPLVPADGAGAKLRAWIDRLEGDGILVAHFRAKLAELACEPCGLAVVFASAADYPRSAASMLVHEGHVFALGSVAELLATTLPLDVAELSAERARALPEHAYALLVEGPNTTTFRFRVTTG
jgi:hypothetical protein